MKPEVTKVERTSIDYIVVPPGRRALNEDAVSRLVDSIKTVGLLHPLTVRWAESKPNADGEIGDEAILVAGAHRLEACKRLGWTHVDTVEMHGDEIDARLREIAENLHRADLTTLERDEQIAEWIRLTEAKVSVQPAPKPTGGRPESGVSKAARGLGIEATKAKRAVKVSGLSDEAKTAAKTLGLDNNQSALLAAAKAETAAAQVEVLRTRAAPKPVKLAPEPRNDFEAVEAQVARLMSAWNAAGREAREDFLARIDRPVFDASEVA